MKRLKFLMAFVFLLVGALTVMSFTSKKYQSRAVALQCLQYNGPQFILTRPDILEPTNWGATSANPNEYCIGGWTLCMICYDNSNTTANLARLILADYYNATGMLPAHGTSIVGANGNRVWVYRSEEL